MFYSLSNPARYVLDNFGSYKYFNNSARTNGNKKRQPLLVPYEKIKYKFNTVKNVPVW